MVARRKRFIKNNYRRLPLLRKTITGFEYCRDYKQVDGKVSDFGLDTLKQANINLEQKTKFHENVSLSDFDTTAEVVESILSDDIKKENEKKDKK